MSGTALMTVATPGKAAMVAAATLDGIVASVLWAHRHAATPHVLYAPEGETGAVFRTPALTEMEGLRQLVCLGLPLADADLEPLLRVVEREGVSEVTWVGHHFARAEHLAALAERGAAITYDPRAPGTTDLILRGLDHPEPWETALAGAIRQAPEDAAEPWRSWWFVFLAVRDEPYSIRRAVAPLTEGRFEAYDPALVAAGRERWAEIQGLAASGMHEIEADGVRAVVVGLPGSRQNEMRIVVDAALRARRAQLGIVFFDHAPRLVLRVLPSETDAVDLMALAASLEGGGLRAYLYDRDTVFLEAGKREKLAVIEDVLRLTRRYFARDRA